MLAQPLTTPVQVTPDCLQYFDFTNNGSSPAFDNRFIGCKTWYVAYTNTGFPALTLTFEDAPDASGAPGAWVAFAGTVVEGMNPNVALTQASTVLYGYYPWQRITLSGATAGAGRRIQGTFYGYRQVPVATVIIPPITLGTVNQGTPNTNANRWPFYLSDGSAAQGIVTNPLFNRLSDGTNAQGVVANPLFGRLSDGTNAQGVQANPLFTRLSDGTNPFGTSANPLFSSATPICTSKAIVALTGAGATQIIAAVGGKTIRVCHLSLSSESPVNVQVVEGTGASCATGPANVTGLYRSVLGMALDFNVSPLTGSASQALCISLGTAVNVGGVLTYAQN
jgi:hypothetical protein